MKKMMLMACAVFAVSGMFAEEFGAEKASGESVAADQKSLETTATRNDDKSAWDQLNEYVVEHGLVVNRKDSKNKRFVVTEKIVFSVRSEEVGAKYLELREGMMSLLLLKAKAKLARARTGQIEASRLSVDDDDTTTLTREMKRMAELEMVGITVLEQFESCQKEDDLYKCQIAILLSWSKENESVAKNIQRAFSNPQQPPPVLKELAGKNTIEGWTRKKAKEGALGDWLGPRRYIDKDGVVWLLGIAATPYVKNERRNDKNMELAKTLAEAEVAWSLYGDVKMSAVINRTMKTLDGTEFDSMTDDEKASFGTKFARVMQDATQMETAGMIYPFESTIKDASGQKINVVVAGISVQSKREALEDLRESEETAKEVKAGRQQEQMARENKIGTPQESKLKVNDSVPTAEKSNAMPQKGGRLGVGVRHYSSDD